MKRSTRRTFLATQACVCCLDTAQTGQKSASAAAWPTQHVNWPREIAGIRVADSKLTRTAAEVLLDSSPAFLVNHAMRTFFFGALIGQRQKLSFDGELLFLACALHDLGLTPKYGGALPFEIQGAQAARRILSSAGLTAENSQIVWDGIAMHPHRMAEFKQAEISLVAVGAGADVVGGIEELPEADVKAILSAFPRLQFKQRFVQTCAEIANKYPGAAKRTFMRDIAERTNPTFKAENICDAIAAAPFSE
jgi:hypothetical protein